MSCRKCNKSWIDLYKEHEYASEIVDRTGLCYACFKSTPASELDCKVIDAIDEDAVVCPFCGNPQTVELSEIPKSDRWEDTCEVCKNRYTVVVEYTATFITSKPS